LKHSGVSEALIGDLVEVYRAEPARLWFWRQALIAGGIHLAMQIRDRKLQAIRAVAVVAASVWFLSWAVAGVQGIDLTDGVQVDVVSTGWSDTGPVGGQNKLVPSVSLTLRNVSSQPLSALQLNAVFRRINDPREWGDAFRGTIARDGLPPGAATGTIVIRSPRGYTGPDPVADMLRNSHFVDTRVTVFGKQGSSPWTLLGEYPIGRQLTDRE
jgi:hypothetical protein